MDRLRVLAVLAIMVILISTLIVSIWFLASNTPAYDSSKNVINIVFRYGVWSKNELDTFEGTYTKDLIANGTVTTRLILTQEELTQIKQKSDEINFFSYPDSFPKIPNRTMYPQFDYYIKIQDHSVTKEVSWNTNSLIDGNMENNLTQLRNYITSLIEQKPEYKALPTPYGGYL
jgi:hypothetical protein